MKKTRPFLSTSVFTVIGRAGGLLIPFLVAFVYGADHRTDAFFFAYGLIFALIGIFTHIFESAIIPYLSKYREDEDLVSALTNKAALMSLPVIIGFCVAVYFSLEPLFVRWGHWTPQAAQLLARMFLELLPLLVLHIWISSFQSIFYTRKIFWFPAVSPLLRSLTVIGFLYGTSQTLGIHALTVGFAAGELLRWAVALGALKKWTPWKFFTHRKDTTGILPVFFKEVSLQLLALLAVNMMFLSDQWFAARTGEGALTLLSYADRLVQIPYLIFVAAFLPIFLTDWSQAYHQKDGTYKNKVNRDSRWVLWISAVLALLLWSFRAEIIRLIYAAKSLGSGDRQVVSQAFGWYALGFIPGMIRLLYGRGLIIMNRSAFYFLQAWVELLLNLFLNAVFVRMWGVEGIAAATAVVYCFSMLWLYVYLQKHMNRRSDL